MVDDDARAETDLESLTRALNAADVDYSQREFVADMGHPPAEPGDWFTFLAAAALAWQASRTPVVADRACDGCNVNPPWEHRCHGEPCSCMECREERALFDRPAPVVADADAIARADALHVLIDTATDALDNDGGYLAADERAQITAAVALLRGEP